MLIHLVIAACLKQDAIEGAVAHFFDRHVMHVRAKGKGAAPSAITFRAPGLDGQIKLRLGLG